jgi:predicted transcriptional regulator
LCYTIVSITIGINNYGNMISISDVLNSISDEKTLDIFNTIAVAKKKNDTYSMKEQIKLTEKQYYSRMHKLLVAGLIKRTNGKYFLTTFGKIVHEHYVGIQNAVNAYSKLRALDEILKNDKEVDFSNEQRLEIIERLIQDTEIKKSILKMV